MTSFYGEITNCNKVFKKGGLSQTFVLGLSLLEKIFYDFIFELFCMNRINDRNSFKQTFELFELNCENM